jgi:hypothetical protein
MNIPELLYNYSFDERERFNPQLFQRNDDNIVRELQNVILTCQRDKYFTIKVNSFEVIDSPIEIYNTMRKYEQDRIDRISKPIENIYDYIPIRNSKTRLMIVHYTIGIRDKYEDLDVLINLPRYTDKYYFELQGNYYLPMFQIVDGSTYNNANTNAKCASTTQKTIFMPIKIFRFHNKLTTIDGEELPIVLYSSNIFNRNIIVFKYLLAKFGLMGTFMQSGIGCIKVLKDKPDDNSNMYIFEKHEIYIQVPKMIFDSDYVTQSLIYTILKVINKDVVYEDLFTIDYWIDRLDNDVTLTKYSHEKGVKLLESLEGIYDPSTKAAIKLPLEYKDDIYKVLLWMIRNFSDLMMKDNQDSSLKRVRLDEYLASLYAIKLSNGIKRISVSGKRATISTIRKAINISPNYLLSQITKCSLVNYRNSVNEDDAIFCTKFSYKGISGIGEKTGSNVSEIQRRMDVSNLCNIDTCSSSDSNPGLTGNITPYSNLREDGFFKDFEEPNSWEEKFSELMNLYKESVGLVEGATFKKKVLGQGDDEEIEILKEAACCLQNTVDYVRKVEENSLIIPGTFVPAYIEK